MTVYRSAAVDRVVAAQRRSLAAHHPTVDGSCAACRAPAPCRSAHDAAAFLADRGLLFDRAADDVPSLLTHVWRTMSSRADETRRAEPHDRRSVGHSSAGPPVWLVLHGRGG